MTNQDCALDCGREVPDTAYVCPSCGAAAVRLLQSVQDELIEGPPARTIPGLATDLDTAITRETNFGTTGAVGETPVLFNTSASEARTVLLSALATWTALIAEQRGLPHPAYLLHDLATFLEHQVTWLRAQPAGAEALDEITAALRNATRAIDRPADRKYAGPCTTADCDGEFIAYDNARLARCRECAAHVELTTRQEQLLTQAHDRLLTAPELEKALGGLGTEVKAKRIHEWCSRGRLTNRGTPDRPLYRVGDVRHLAALAAARRGTKVAA
ncbi:hypothetical protein [Oerskovia paurometabola]|uniref:hypothetical protein n=1 Tax=Oerskovia paurometabola TaxID=162170 RepID=UPI003421E3E0